MGNSGADYTIRLAQLPLAPSAALAPTGNVPLAAGCLASGLERAGLLGRVSVEVVPASTIDPMGDAALAESLAEGEPDLLSLSLYLWNAERSLHVAREVKRLSPGTQVAIGGPEVSGDNTWLLESDGYDYAIAGEGEAAFARLVTRKLEGGEPGPGEFDNIGIRTDKGFILGEGRQDEVDLSRYRCPYEAGFIEVGLDGTAYMETSRGCTMRCAYCFYSRGSGSVRFLPVNDAVARARRLIELGAREVVFLDPSLDKRPDFAEFLDGLAGINQERQVRFFAELRADNLDARLMDLLAKAGFTHVEIGLQSVNAATLEGIGRGGSPERTLRAASELRSRGIEPVIDIIAGLPGDEPDDLLSAAKMLADRGLAECAQVMQLSVLPGTELRARAEDFDLDYAPNPPYRAFITEEMEAALVEVEEMLGLTLEEMPRHHLISPSGAHAGLPEALEIDLDDGPAHSGRIASMKGARHLALWVRGRDMWREREALRAAVEARLRTDPFSVLDLVLRPECEFPLDLIDFAHQILKTGSEGSSRRLAVVLPKSFDPSPGFVDELMLRTSVYKDMSFGGALHVAGKLGTELPSARIVGEVPLNVEMYVGELARRADPESVCFEDRTLEARWTLEVLGHGRYRA